MDSILFAISGLGTLFSLIEVRKHRTAKELIIFSTLLIVFSLLFIGDLWAITKGSKPWLFSDPYRPFLLRPFLLLGLITCLIIDWRKNGF